METTANTTNAVNTAPKVNVQDKQEIQIDFMSILERVLKYIVLIVLFCSLGAVCTYAYKTYTSTTSYTATTTIYVCGNKSGGSSSSDMQQGELIIEDAIPVMKNVTVLEQVVAELDLNMSASTLSRKINVYSVNDARILAISVTDPDPYLATRIANGLREISITKVKSIMAMETVNTVNVARIPTAPTRSSATRYALIAFVALFIVCVGILVVIDIFDDKLTTPEEIELQLGLNVLGSIPYVDKEDADKNDRKK